MNQALTRNRVADHSSNLNSMMEQFFGGSGGPGIQAYFVPASVWEDASSYHIELDVPGVVREHVELTLEKGMLRVSTERQSPEESRAALVDERRYGRVTRTVTLPESIDPDSIVAELKSGVLHVTVAKKPEAQPKRIAIR